MNVLCLKLRARQTWAPPPAAPKVMCNAPRHLITKCLWRDKLPDKMSPPLQITEDTPPDMLAGSMDLCVMLPNGHTVKMSVERSTPMMDLLVQVTTANKISPAGHTIQALGERGVMPYKPSTPIGALDTWTIHIVPKNQVGLAANRKAPLKTVNQPFEQTFRLQVHLPRNQLFVTRISPKTKLSDILTQVCSEKNLDSSKYSLRHPVNLDQVLNLSYCLADYKLTEVALVSNRSWPLGVSSVDIMSLQQNDNAGYNYNMSRNSRSCEGSMSSGSIGGRSLSPTRSDGSSASPPPVVPPNRPLRKRRPAPKPPVNINNNNNINNSNNNNNNNNIDSNKCEQQQSSSQGSQNTVICHSRNSSDSSGYHEASVLSESPESNSLPDSLPRRSKLPSASIAESNSSKVASNLSRSLSNLTTVGNSGIPSMKSHSVSSTSLVSITGRKKKAAPPPPSLISRMSSVSEEIPKQRTPSVSSNASSSATLEDNDHNPLRKSSTLPASIRVAQPSSNPEPTLPEISQNNSVVNEPPCSSFDRLHDAPVELPKPKPRTIFPTETVTSDTSTKLTGDGTEPTKPAVNRKLPRKSIKSYPAPAPKPRNSSECIINQDNCTKINSSQDNLICDNEEEIMRENLCNEEDPQREVILDQVDFVSKERRIVDRTRSVDDTVLCNGRSSDSLIPLEFDSESITSSMSSVFVKTDSPENRKKLKEFPSDTSLLEKGESNRERNFSMGNLDDVPAFLSKSPQLGRWKNMECLAEACPNACGIDQNSELEAVEEKKVDPASELRLDDDEIDRIFHNATRDHASLESGVGDEPPLSLLSLPSPPSSLTNQPESSVNNNTEALDWEYKLPAPPTFRDETNSPTVTEFDTVTIGNLTEVFGPGSIAELQNKKPVIKNEPDLLNSQVINGNKITRDTLDAVSQIKENDKLVIYKNVENINNENSKTSRINEQSMNKSTAVVRSTIDSESIKPDLLKHSHIEGETVTSPDVEKSAVICELSSVINERLVRPEVNVNDIENSIKTRNSSDVQQSCTLDNFVITTYKETKPIEVFEDDSIKSSNGERRDSSRDEAMFRAPKSIPRRFEPNLTRRSSFNSSDKPINISVKRSVSHVSLLAGNVSRGPYRSHLARSNGALTETAQLPEETESTGSRLRKTTSELNISQGAGDSKITDWRTGDTVGLQSLQVLRSILPQIRNSQSCVDSVGASEVDIKHERVAPVSSKKFERTLSEETEEVPSKEPSVAKRYSYSGPPSVNLTTWSERPKRQVSIKMDRDYCSGFGKLKANVLDETKTKDSAKSNELTNGYSSTLVQQSHSKIDEKPDIVKHSNDISRVPIVRAVELKKPFSSSNIDVSDLSRCGYFNGRSYENLNCVDNDFKPNLFNKYHEPVLQSSSSSTSCKSAVSVGSKIHPSVSTSNVKFSAQQTDEERSSVTSLAKRFGEPKPRPASCYLYNTPEKQTDRNDDYCVKSGNTSRVFLNASDNKKFTSIVGINGVDNNHSSNVRSNKTEIKIFQKPQFQSSKVMIGVKNSDDKTVGFKINGNIYSSKAENSSASDVRSQAKISSGGYLEDAGNKVPSFGNKVSHNTSLRHNSNVMPVVKGFRKVENKTSTSEQVNSGGIPPPPPVLPILKPAGERKQIKTLPPPQADPRDQLLESIRNFGGTNSLKKVALK